MHSVETMLSKMHTCLLYNISKGAIQRVTPQLVSVSAIIVAQQPQMFDLGACWRTYITRLLDREAA
jgi:hypothetical protein